MSPEVQVTTDYNKFRFIESNREQSRGHIETLKKAFEENGNLTANQPILVNENMEIIDGQHRFTACMELGMPIHYIQTPGLTVRDARQMNILHKGWGVDDYARSYALAGDNNYRKYLELKEEYGFNHSVLLGYILNSSDRTNMYKDFRNGDFTFTDREGARERLDKLASVGQYVPFAGEKGFAGALLKTMAIEGYDHERMLRKLELHQNLLRRFVNIEDYQRMLEDVYNYQMQEGNRLRFF
jgi:hypothetical protein